MSLGFDADLRLTSESLNGNTVEYRYDADDLLTSGGATAIHRDPATGFVTAQSLGVVTTSLARNVYGEVDDRRVQAADTEVFRTEVLARDPAGRVTSRRETALGEAHAYDYSYDRMGASPT